MTSRSLNSRGLLTPAEIARLQRVFDVSCARREAMPDSEEAREIALNILALHNAGMVDEEMLIDAVGFRTPKAKSA